ncbi:hypothetical protein Pfo_017957 [Paulownia fortunei]|nr:hypothetical protein Pfo_017957 [Paulownia fortunei]
MEPSSSSTTNSRSHENQYENHTSTTTDHHQPLILSCKPKPHQENSLNPTLCVSEASLMENAGYEQEKDESGREKIMGRHCKEVGDGGGIVIPETWGQEGLLKDWTQHSTFDALLAPKEAVLARQALVAEARRGPATGIPKLSV